MQSSPDAPQDPHPQSQIPKLQQLLTKLLTQLSQMLQSVLRIIIISQDSPLQTQIQTIEGALNKLKNSLYYKISYRIQGYIHQQPVLSSFSIFKRFSCRVIEVLMPIKQRVDDNQMYMEMREVLGKVQNGVIRLQEDYILIEFIQTVCFAIAMFVNNCRNRILKKINREKPFYQQKMSESVVLYSTSRQRKSESFQFQPEYQKKLKKALASVNSRFKTIQDCMDLDYSHYRATCFQSKNKQDLYDLFLERNIFINAQIHQYRREYENYVNGVQKKNKKKAEIRQNAGNSIRFTSLQPKSTKLEGKQFEKTTPFFMQRKISLKDEKKQKSTRFLTKKMSLSLSEDIHELKENESKQKISHYKPKYEMKNILITASKIKLEPCMLAIRKNGPKNNLRQLELSRKRGSKVENRPLLRNLRQICSISGPVQ